MKKITYEKAGVNIEKEQKIVKGIDNIISQTQKNISGKIEEQNQNWTFANLIGFCNNKILLFPATE
ncbi:MAG: hypothetical protein B6U87_01290 [Candidatus Aenigmarchaeota archaeon ex4484_52]|nr:MAG: hypothetical protein B6U87_01290 [Candidatus Aenigmarchaeota archaeon ex4484_52]